MSCSLVVREHCLHSVFASTPACAAAPAPCAGNPTRVAGRLPRSAPCQGSNPALKPVAQSQPSKFWLCAAGPARAQGSCPSHRIPPRSPSSHPFCPCASLSGCLQRAGGCHLPQRAVGQVSATSHRHGYRGSPLQATLVFSQRQHGFPGNPQLTMSAWQAPSSLPGCCGVCEAGREGGNAVPEAQGPRSQPRGHSGA